MPRTAKFDPQEITSIYEKKVAQRVRNATKARINRESLRLITNISDDMRDHIGNLLKEGEDEGRSVAATASKLLTTGLDAGVFRSARKRAWLIARTELHRSRQLAAVDIYKANNIKLVKWIVIDDGRLCTICRPHKNRTYNIDDLSEDSLPPVHPRCRCRVIPADLKLDISVKKTRAGKVMKTKISPTPTDYKYVIKVKKSLEKAQVHGFTRTRHGHMETVRPYMRSVAQIAREMLRDKQDAGKRYNINPKNLVFAGVQDATIDPKYGKQYMYLWNVEEEKHELHHSTITSGKMHGEEIQKGRPYVRVKRGKFEHVKGYPHKPRIWDLSPAQCVEQILLDPQRLDTKLTQQIALDVNAIGGRVLVVGGGVRDALLGKQSKDIDVEVYGVRPDELRVILERIGKVDAVGMSFGVLKLSSSELTEAIDVSVPRRESKVGKGHKGFMTEPDPSMTTKEAAMRRDLTINSMSYDPIKREIIDDWGGLQDLKDKKLRAVNPETFKEDPLRVLRVMQFASRLGFTPDVELVKTCRELEPELETLPKERIFGELEKLLLRSKEPSIGLRLIPMLGVNKLFPELDSLRGVKQDEVWHPEGSAWEHTMMVVDAASKFKKSFGNSRDQLVLMLSALCHDLGKPETTEETADGKIISHGHDEEGAKIAREFLERLTADSDILERTTELVRTHMYPTMFYKQKVGDGAIRRLARRVDLSMLIALSAADKMGRGIEPDLSAERWMIRKYKKLGLHKPEALQPFVMGRHLIEIGIPPGIEMGRMLKKIYEAQLEGKFNTSEEGIEYARGQGWLELEKAIPIKGFVRIRRGHHEIVKPYTRTAERDKSPKDVEMVIGGRKVVANAITMLGSNQELTLGELYRLKEIGQMVSALIYEEGSDRPPRRVEFNAERLELPKIREEAKPTKKHKTLKTLAQEVKDVQKEFEEPPIEGGFKYDRWASGSRYKGKIKTDPGQAAAIKRMYGIKAIVSEDKARELVKSVKKRLLKGKLIPKRINGKLLWFKSFGEEGLYRFAKANFDNVSIGDKVLFDDDLIKVMAIGRDGVTGRRNGTRYQLLFDDIKLAKSEDTYLRTRLGKKEVVHKPRKWKVTFADGTFHILHAKTRFEAAQNARSLNRAPIKIDDLGEVI